MTDLSDLKARFTGDQEFREEFRRIDDDYARIEAPLRLCTESKGTQAESAQQLGTTQLAIVRQEDGRVYPPFKTLRQFAKATGNRLTVGQVPEDG